jgi:hypothetical protein
VAKVVVPVTVKRLETDDVPAERSTKLPFNVPKLVVKKNVVVAESKNAFRAKILVLVLLVVEALVATNLVAVANIRLALVEKRLVEDASVAKNVVDVLLVITDEEARRAPFNARVFTADR